MERLLEVRRKFGNVTRSKVEKARFWIPAEVKDFLELCDRHFEYSMTYTLDDVIALIDHIKCSMIFILSLLYFVRSKAQENIGPSNKKRKRTHDPSQGNLRKRTPAT